MNLEFQDQKHLLAFLFTNLFFTKKNINKFTLFLMKNNSEIVHENQYFVINLLNIDLINKLCNLILIVDHIIKNYKKFRNY